MIPTRNLFEWGNWLTASSVFSLDVSPKYPWRHMKGWKHKMKLKTKTGSCPNIRFWEELTLIICQMIQDWEKDNQGLSHGMSWLCLMKQKLLEQREIFCISPTRISGSKDLGLEPKRKCTIVLLLPRCWSGSWPAIRLVSCFFPCLSYLYLSTDSKT